MTTMTPDNSARCQDNGSETSATNPCSIPDDTILRQEVRALLHRQTPEQIRACLDAMDPLEARVMRMAYGIPEGEVIL